MATCSFADGQSKSNAGVTEGHDSSKNGQEPQPVEVWNLAQQDLESTKNQHEWVVGDLQHMQQAPDLNKACSVLTNEKNSATPEGAMPDNDQERSSQEKRKSDKKQRQNQKKRKNRTRQRQRTTC